jgi:hypothetical protein
VGCIGELPRGTIKRGCIYLKLLYRSLTEKKRLMLWNRNLVMVVLQPSMRELEEL